MSTTPAPAVNPMRPGRQFPIGKPVDESVPEPARRQTSQGYVAPTVRHGQLVVYYPQGVVTRNGQLAAVLQTGMRGTITVRNIGSRQVQDSVPHVGDPRLKRSVEAKVSGAWDLTEDDKARAGEIEELNRKVNVLTSFVEKLSATVDAIQATKSTPADPIPPLAPASEQSEREQLFAQAKELGVAVRANASNDTIRKAIQEHVAAAAAADAVT